MEWLLSNVSGEWASAVVSVIAIAISIFAIRKADRTSQVLTSGEYVASQSVKSDTFQLFAALRSLQKKYARWTLGPKYKPLQQECPVDIKPEKDAIAEFLTSTTFCVYIAYEHRIADDEKTVTRLRQVSRNLADFSFCRDKCESEEEIAFAAHKAILIEHDLTELMQNKDVFRDVVRLYGSDVDSLAKDLADQDSLDPIVRIVHQQVLGNDTSSPTGETGN